MSVTNWRGNAHETMSDNTFNAALAWAWTISWWICYPIGVVLWYLMVVVLFVLNLLYRPVAFLLQPVIYLARFALSCLVFPFTLAARLEVSRSMTASNYRYTDNGSDDIYLSGRRRSRRTSRWPTHAWHIQHFKVDPPS